MATLKCHVSVCEINTKYCFSPMTVDYTEVWNDGVTRYQNVRPRNPS